MTSATRPAPGAEIMAPSSPTSRPSPPGGLRPAFDTGCDGTGQHRSGAGNEEHQQSKIRLTEVSTVSGDCRAVNGAAGGGGCLLFFISRWCMRTTGVPQRCADKVRKLIKAGKDIPPPPKQKQFITEPSIRDELRPYTSWRGWAVSLLTGALPPARTYLVEFVNRTKYDDKECLPIEISKADLAFSAPSQTSSNTVT
jgi:hypothetical protein